jgi:hypothetical protein
VGLRRVSHRAATMRVMPRREGPTKRIEQLRGELEAEGKIPSKQEDPSPEPAWKVSTK